MAAGSSRDKRPRAWQAGGRSERSARAETASLVSHLEREHSEAECPALVAAITKYFGSLRNALQAAGLESRRAKWTKRRVTEAIQDLYVHGPARKNRVSRPAVRAAAQRHFGSWGRALRAAGVEPRVFERWTPERVIEEIQARHGRGLSLTSVWREHPRLFAAGQRYFGGWHQALRAAGLTPTLRTPAHKK